MEDTLAANPEKNPRMRLNTDAFSEPVPLFKMADLLSGLLEEECLRRRDADLFRKQPAHRTENSH